MEDMVKILIASCLFICLSCNQKKIEFGYLHVQTIAEMFHENQYIEIHFHKNKDSLYYQFHDDNFGIHPIYSIPVHELNDESLPLADTLDRLILSRTYGGNIFFKINTDEYKCEIINETENCDFIRSASLYMNDFWARRKNYLENELIPE